MAVKAKVISKDTAFEDNVYRRMYSAMDERAKRNNYDPRYAYMACRGVAMAAAGRRR